jgi:hypothetical protein
MNDTTRNLPPFRFQMPSLVIGVIGLAASGAGAFMAQEQFFRSWLVAFVFWTALTVGSLGILMLQYMTGGWWGYMIRRPLLAATTNFPLVILAAIPVYLGAEHLYKWMDHDLMEHDHILHQKIAYLNWEAFAIRGVVFFGLWALWAFMVRKRDREFEESGTPQAALSLRRWSAPGILMIALTGTFASVDWMMSLDPYWFSTMFGISFMVGAGLSAFSFSILVLTGMADHSPIKEVAQPIYFRDLGNLTFAFVMLWAYTAFSQFLLIWYGNIKEEIPWYLVRSHGGWGVVSVMMIVLHFFLPFLLLLQRGIKDKPKFLSKVVLFILVMRAVDYFWIIAPTWTTEGHHAAFKLHWLDFTTILGLGGIWVFLFFRALGKRDVLASRAQFQEESKEALNHG